MKIEKETSTTSLREVVLRKYKIEVSLQQWQSFKTDLLGQSRVIRRKQATDNVHEEDLTFHSEALQVSRSLQRRSCCVLATHAAFYPSRTLRVSPLTDEAKSAASHSVPTSLRGSGVQLTEVGSEPFRSEPSRGGGPHMARNMITLLSSR